MISVKKWKEIDSLGNVTFVGTGLKGQVVIGTSKRNQVSILSEAYPDAKIMHTGLIIALDDTHNPRKSVKSGERISPELERFTQNWKEPKDIAPPQEV